MTSSLDVTYLNHSETLLRPTLTDRERRAIDEVLSLYSPYGPLRTFTTYFRPGIGLPMYVGHGQYFDFDYVLQRLLGLSGLNTGFGGQVYGGGKGHDLFGMLAASVGEAVERVLGAFAYVMVQDRLLTGSFRDLKARGLDALHPSDVPMFSKEQYADPDMMFEPWGEDTPLGWLPGTRLFSGETVYVPAQLVLLFYAKSEGEPTIGLAPSGGLSSHISRKHALTHGILELVERDAVNVRWYSKVPLDRIVVDRPIVRHDVRRVLHEADRARTNLDFYVHNLDLEEFPVITAIQHDPSYARYSYHAGGGVGGDIESVMASALSELSQAERSLRVSLSAPEWEFSSAFRQMFDIDPDAEPHQFSNFIQAIPYYGYPENWAKTDWYFNSGNEVALSELPSMEDTSIDALFAQVEAALRSRNWDPICFDLTPPGLETTALLKVFMPELCAPYPPSSPGLGHPRYYELPFQAGRKDRLLTWDDINLEPLPYP